MNESYKAKVTFAKYVDRLGLRMSASLTPTVGESNAQSITECFLLWCKMCLDMLSQYSGWRCTSSILMTSLGRFEKEGFHYVDWLDDLSEIDQNCVRNGRNICDLSLRSNWLLTIVKWYGFTPSHRELHQFCEFPKRLNVKDSPELERQAMLKFFTNCRRVFLFHADDYDDLEAHLFRYWANEYWDPSYLSDLSHYRFSSGSVAERNIRSCRARKYVGLRGDPRLAYFCKEFGLQIPFDNVESRPYPNMLMFVPKSYKAYRSVCMENSTHTFFQNAVADSLLKGISHSYLTNHINLSNQQLSRDAALQGSATRRLATIDLSMASDSIGWNKIRVWLRGTRLYKALMLVRVSHYEYNTVLHRSPIAFTMGSPICMPLQCIIYSMIIAATLISMNADIHKVYWRVYGDDIVIESRYAEALMERLRQNGFLPNEEKSFWRDNQPFREACGLDAYNGVDITPVRLGRKFDGTYATPNGRASAIALANDAYSRGYFGVYHHCISRLCLSHYVTYSDTLDALTEPSSTVVFSPYARDLNTWYWSPRLQQTYTYVWGTGIRHLHLDADEEYGTYLYQLHKPSQPISVFKSFDKDYRRTIMDEITLLTLSSDIRNPRFSGRCRTSLRKFRVDEASLLDDN